MRPYDRADRIADGKEILPPETRIEAVPGWKPPFSYQQFFGSAGQTYYRVRSTLNGMFQVLLFDNGMAAIFPENPSFEYAEFLKEWIPFDVEFAEDGKLHVAGEPVTTTFEGMCIIGHEGKDALVYPDQVRGDEAAFDALDAVLGEQETEDELDAVFEEEATRDKDTGITDDIIRSLKL